MNKYAECPFYCTELLYRVICIFSLSALHIYTVHEVSGHVTASLIQMVLTHDHCFPVDVFPELHVYSSSCVCVRVSKCSSLPKVVTSLGCLTFTRQNKECAEFDSRSLFSHSSAEETVFSQLVWKLILVHVQFHTWTSVHIHWGWTFKEEGDNLCLAI